MATLHKDIFIAASPDHVWDAVRDIGALHTRLVPGFVLNTLVEDDGEARTVTFANGLVVREAILSLDDERRRIAWTAEGGGVATHYNAALTVEPTDTGSHVLWTTDFLPNAQRESIAAMQDQALRSMKRALESDAAEPVEAEDRSQAPAS
jgi:carbon monoxide dehydrogenase subunit G